ncbi:hypothetical protein SZN_31224 [Streptomyces zinciresistens K42]|uniref:Integral membrane protein n=1 Tax=Streptomyces zinciresistens K42 TaxID=700597 RepID=G2GL49_9ACTN|nr:hypothetical protein [Streptomyces zinciresistens]EGX55769.1 hypothetical protein SZN_31224 [Streptomyces zinciresistens K42]
MRSVRMLLATATATAALAITPTAYAVTMGDWGNDDGSYSKERDKSEDQSYSKERDKDDKRDEPRGGMRTGGGALAAVGNGDDWGGDKDPKYDPDTYRNKDQGPGKEPWKGGEERGNDSWKGDNDSWGGGDQEKGDSWGGDRDESRGEGGGDRGKPLGGMHTGGGGLATPSVTAAGLAVLGVAGTGMYAMRRKKAGGLA